ncbi:MAG: family 43 glycosylhydrolase [Prolixibacteraceae bacterium]|nr:family 43 glycosylhydrolase [Prolixibacteraceae bacterium]
MIYSKYIIFFLFLSSININLLAQNPSFTTFMNPVIPGDHPDPTLTRIGKDFYTTGSSFSPTPVIYHSTDLVHWRAIAQPVSATWSLYGKSTGDGCWGGHLVYYGNKYWDFFGHWGTMYFTTATKPEGPWSTPVAVTCPASVPGLGMDNSIFIDDDGLWYMLVKNGQENNWILQLGTNGQPSGKILDLHWINPAPSYPFGWAEGPVMWKYKGYYYYSFAINAGGGQKVFRSKTLTADKTSWQNMGDFFNEADPKKSQALFQGSNHCSPVIMLDDSTSWVIYHSYLTANSREWEGIGRQGLLSRVRYNAAGKPTADYPINEPMIAPKLPSGGIPWMVPHSDFFDATKLNPEWSLLGFVSPIPYTLTARPGWLRLTASNLQNTVIKTDAEHNYSLITRLDHNPKATTHEAGIRIMTGLQNLSACLYSSANSSGEKVIRFTFGTTTYEAANTIGTIVWLKLVRVNHVLTGYFSANGFDWTIIGKSINVQTMDIQQPDYNAWTGSRQGLYVKGASADFDLYIYREAFNPVMAECYANQSGTTRSTPAAGLSILDNIHSGDWAMYAGVEFGDPNYPVHLSSFEATASSVSSSGVIEVWLDSLQTGKKIGECLISSTGSLSTYKTFTVDLPEVTGNHDVYLKFRGDGTAKLFQLKSFRFIGGLKQVTTNRSTLNESEKLRIFPNPAKNAVTITHDEAFSKIRILNANGQLVDQRKFGNDLKTVTLRIALPAGNYLVEINTKNGSICRKLSIQ